MNDKITEEINGSQKKAVTPERSSILESLSKTKERHSRRSENTNRPTFNPLRSKTINIDKKGEQEPPKDKDRPLTIQEIMLKRQEEETGGKDLNEIEEIQKVVNDYKKVVSNQEIASNIVFLDIKQSIHEEFDLILHEEEEFKEKKVKDLKSFDTSSSQRKDIKNALDQYRESTVNLIERDIRKHFTNKRNLIESIPERDIELVRKIHFTERNVEYTTDHGHYVFDGRETSLFGGFINLNLDIITENIDIADVIRRMALKNKDAKAKAYAHFWLLIEPFLVQANNDKWLMLPLEYIFSALTHYQETLAERQASEKSFISKARINDSDIRLLNEGKTSRRELVLRLQNLDVPKTSSLILFPYNFLKESGIDFTMDISERELSNMLSTINRKDHFIRFDELENDIKHRNYLEELNKVRRYILRMTEYQRETKVGLQIERLARTIEGITDTETMTSLLGEDYVTRLQKREYRNLRSIVGYPSESAILQRRKENEEEVEFDMNINEPTVRKVMTKDEENKIIDNLTDAEYIEYIADIQQGKTPRVLRGNTQSRKTSKKGKDNATELLDIERELFINYLDIFSIEVEGIMSVLKESEKFISVDKNLETYLGRLKGDIDSLTYVDPGNNSELDELTLVYIVDGSNKLFEVNLTLDDIVNEGLAGRDYRDLEEFQRVKQALKERLYYINTLLSGKEGEDGFIGLKNYTTQAIETYNRGRANHHEMVSLLGQINQPEVRNLKSTIKLDNYELDISHLILDGLKKAEPSLAEHITKSTKYSLPVRRAKSDDYVLVRAIAIALRQEQGKTNWKDMLKLVLAESKQPRTYIRNTPELGILLKDPIVLPKIKLVNDNQKIRNVGEGEGEIKPLTDKDHKLNEMFDELFKDRPGLICAIDFVSLMNYIISVDTGLYEGNEIVKYIPAPFLVNKYFPVPRTSMIYPVINNLALNEEITRQPPVYVGLNSIMDLASREMELSIDKLREHIELVLDYKEEIDSINVQPVKGLGEIRAASLNYDSELNRYGVLYRRMVTDSTTHFDIIEGRKRIENMIANHLEFNIPTSEAREYETIYNEIGENLKKYERELDEARKAREDILEEVYTKRNDKVKEMKEKVDKELGGTIDEIVTKIIRYHDHERAKAGLINLSDKIGLMRFPKGQALINFIITFVKDEVGFIQGAIFRIVEKFLHDITTIESNRGIDSPNARAEEIKNIFRIMIGELNIQNSLRLSFKEEMELDQLFRPREETVHITEEDVKYVRDFVANNQYSSPETFRNEIRNFDKKDMIPDSNYIDILSNDPDFLEEMYKGWYNVDLTLSDNLSVMLACGFPKEELNPKHLNDKKLMDIVESTQIDEDYIESMKRTIEYNRSIVEETK